jgi:hypothetical protein
VEELGKTTCILTRPDGGITGQVGSSDNVFDLFLKVSDSKLDPDTDCARLIPVLLNPSTRTPDRVLPQLSDVHYVAIRAFLAMQVQITGSIIQ